jgi:hypothetical protein
MDVADIGIIRVTNSAFCGQWLVGQHFAVMAYDAGLGRGCKNTQRQHLLALRQAPFVLKGVLKATCAAAAIAVLWPVVVAPSTVFLTYFRCFGLGRQHDAGAILAV